MSNETHTITLTVLDTALALSPLGCAAIIFIIYTQKTAEIIHASARMVLQLIAIGYFLTYLFGEANTLIGYSFLTLMLCIASYIALRHVKTHKKQAFLAIFIALGLSTTLAILWTALFVLKLAPFYQPHILIPISGMVLATGMNTLSVCIERLHAEKAQTGEKGDTLTGMLPHTKKQEKTAFNAALIPTINSFFAVGLVSLPGMMTGQILSGTSPIVAVRYQIMIMSILFFSAVVSVFLYLILYKRLINTQSNK